MLDAAERKLDEHGANCSREDAGHSREHDESHSRENGASHLRKRVGRDTRRQLGNGGGDVDRPLVPQLESFASGEVPARAVVVVALQLNNGQRYIMELTLRLDAPPDQMDIAALCTLLGWVLYPHLAPLPAPMPAADV